MSKQILTQETVRELLDYDPETGVFTWKPRPLSSFKDETRGKIWNVRFAGAVAGGPHNSGYIRIAIDGKRHLAHRLAWFHVHGRWPKQMLDHINMDRGDNRIDNLREATNSLNMQNQRLGRGRSPYLGVSWYTRIKKWKAQIRAEGKVHCLGLFDTEEAAYAAYIKAKRKLHPGFVEAAA